MNRYITTLLCTVTTILLTLGVYVLQSGRSPLPRLAYALFVSAVPGLLTLVVSGFKKLSARWTVVVYVVMFVLLTIAQGVLR